MAELRAAVEANPADPQARFDLAQALHATGDVQGAVDELLELFRRDREWKNGAVTCSVDLAHSSSAPQNRRTGYS